MCEAERRSKKRKEEKIYFKGMRAAGETSLLSAAWVTVHNRSVSIVISKGPSVFTCQCLHLMWKHIEASFIREISPCAFLTKRCDCVMTFYP